MMVSEWGHNWTDTDRLFHDRKAATGNDIAALVVNCGVHGEWAPAQRMTVNKQVPRATSGL